MAIVRKGEALDSMRVRKRFSRPNGYGQAVYGYSRYGHDNDWAGIYQQRNGLDGKVTVKEKYYWPSNPQTEAQQANRGTFADAISGWQGLTDEQKEVYNQRAIGKHMSGYNLYIKEYMYSH